MHRLLVRYPHLPSCLVAICLFLLSTVSAQVEPVTEATVETTPKKLKKLYDKVCLGTSTGLSHGHSDDTIRRYDMYKKQYTNCTYIDGNLEIVFLEHSNEFDMSFLKDIQEVSGYVLIFGNYFSYMNLDSLRVIRGKTLFSNDDDVGDFALYISKNYKISSTTVGLKELRMTSLVEILAGDVYFYENRILCYERDILWKDIFNREDSVVVFDSVEKVVDCEACSANCTISAKIKDTGPYCWGFNLCQKLTKEICKKDQCGDDSRCFGTEVNQCCRSECVGGCSGLSKSDCFVDPAAVCSQNGNVRQYSGNIVVSKAIWRCCGFCSCENFYDEGMCIDACPPPEIYNSQTYKWEPNPDAKFAYGHECVKQCPDHLYVDKGACVKECREGHMEENRKCVPCKGPCPKTCPGTGRDEGLNNENIDSFKGCTIVNGNINIYQSTFTGDPYANNTAGLTMEQLSVLETVQVIEHFLHIDAHFPGFTNLSFLRNLRVIKGNELNFVKKALHIHNTTLESLNLDSLTNIYNGDILVSNNGRLCYANLTWTTLLRKNSTAKLKTVNNKAAELCLAENKTCSSQCTTAGCWASGVDHCLACIGFKQNKSCVNECDPHWFALTVNGTKLCKKCHSECSDSCKSEDADGCIGPCKHFNDGPFCVAECPSVKYPDSNGTCQMCHENCVGGCTGPENNLGPNACNKCAVVIYDVSEKPSSCMPDGSYCDSGYYSPSNHRDKFLACKMCSSECAECSGHGSNNCDFSTCKNFYDIEGGRCIEKCPSNYFADQSNSPPTCHKCHEDCMKCTGFSNSDCISCRQFKVYYDYGDREQNTKFNCTAECPDWAANIVLDKDHKNEAVCIPDVFAEHSRSTQKSQVGLIVGLTLSFAVLIAIIIAVIFFLKRQRAQAELRKRRLEAQMGGFDEYEPLSPSSANPDMATLRLISESELQRDQVIGSGAFGTVYKGAWVPPGENIRMPVAIKVLQEGTSSSQNKELLEEARVMASVNHTYCVRIVAICMSTPMQLITPLMPFGSLLDYLRKNKDNIGSKVLLNWATQIAKGMKYLEDRGIVHRDLAARNVLVKNNNLVKITDFGLSKLLDVHESEFKASDGKLPIKWMAVECIRYRIFTHKSDVWSYGVTIWELFTFGMRPYDGVSAADVLEVIEKGERLSQPDICTIDVYMIMIKCWMVDQESRPSFQDLTESFTKMCRDPGRYLVIKGDNLLRLPTEQIETKDLLSEEGLEDVISAEDYYLQPHDKKRGSIKKPHDDYLEPAANQKTKNINLEAALTDKRKKMKDRSSSFGSRYTSDPVDKTKTDKNVSPNGKDVVDFPVPSGPDENDYLQPVKPSEANVVLKSDAGTEKSSKKPPRKTQSEYLRMSALPTSVSNPEYMHSNSDKKAKEQPRLMEKIVDQEDDYLLETKPVDSKPASSKPKGSQENNYYNDDLYPDISVKSGGRKSDSSKMSTPGSDYHNGPASGNNRKSNHKDVSEKQYNESEV